MEQPPAKPLRRASGARGHETEAVRIDSGPASPSERPEGRARGQSETNPSESSNVATGSGRIRDPYPTYASLRAQSPVYEGRLDRVFGLPALDAAGFGDGPQFVALSYDAVSQVLLDGQTFPSKGYAKTMGLVMGHSILEMDEPEHRTYRVLIQQAFTLKAVQKWETEVVSPIVDALVDRFASRGQADLVRELTFPFPIQVISALLGLPEEDLPFHARVRGCTAPPGVDGRNKFRPSPGFRSGWGRFVLCFRSMEGGRCLRSLRPGHPDAEGGAAT